MPILQLYCLISLPLAALPLLRRSSFLPIHDALLPDSAKERDLSPRDSPLVDIIIIPTRTYVNQVINVLPICDDLLALPATLAEVHAGKICRRARGNRDLLNGGHLDVLCCECVLCRDWLESIGRRGG